MRSTPIERIMARVVETPGPLNTPCWISGYYTWNGYALIDVGRKKQRVHVVVFEHFVGLVPGGLVLDHLCRVRACCNPAHLEAVTNRENLLRGEHPNFVAFRTNVCVSGRHSMVDAMQEAKGRRCLHCRREAKRRYAARDKALKAAGLFGPLTPTPQLSLADVVGRIAGGKP